MKCYIAVQIQHIDIAKKLYKQHLFVYLSCKRIGSISARDSFPEHLSPTKIADKFKNLYEVEWYAAVGLIGTKQGQRRHQTSEEEDYAIYKLLRIIRVSDIRHLQINLKKNTLLNIKNKEITKNCAKSKTQNT